LDIILVLLDTQLIDGILYFLLLDRLYTLPSIKKRPFSVQRIITAIAIIRSGVARRIIKRAIASTGKRADIYL